MTSHILMRFYFRNNVNLPNDLTQYSYQLTKHIIFLLEIAIKWQFKCIFAFRLQHKAPCWLI